MTRPNWRPALPVELAHDPGHFDDGYLRADADDDPLSPELVELIKDAIDELPEPDKSVVECLVYGQMTKTEVARLLGRSRQSIHDVWLRALDTLRASLRGVEDELHIRAS